MITYFIRTNFDGSYTVSKWNMGTLPIEIYTVKLGPKPKCTCASGHNRGYCKHTGMVKAWVNRGMPLEEISA